MIDEKAAKAHVMANYPNDPLLRHIVINVLDTLPKVDAVGVVHGRWFYLNDYQSQCTKCFEIMWVDHDNEPNYCPNCGAKMDGDGNA